MPTAEEIAKRARQRAPRVYEAVREYEMGRVHSYRDDLLKEAAEERAKRAPDFDHAEQLEREAGTIRNLLDVLEES